MKKINTIKFFSLILFVILSLFVIRSLGFSGFMSPTELRESIFVYSQIAPLMFILFYIIFTLLLFPGTVLTISAGILFGTFLGTVYSVIGATIGASLAFVFSRYMGRSFISEIESKNKRIKEYENKIQKKGLETVLFLRIIPLFPFNILNFTLGLTKVRFKNYFLGTFIGIIPGVFVLAYFGDSVAELNFISIIISSMLFLLLIFSSKIYHHFKKRFSKK